MSRKRDSFETLDDAMNRLRGKGTRQENIFYVDKPLGLKFLGSVDFIRKHKGFVVFSKPPRKESMKGVIV